MLWIAFLYRVIPNRALRTLLGILAAVSLVAGITYGLFFFNLAAKGATPRVHATRNHRTTTNPTTSDSH